MPRRPKPTVLRLLSGNAGHRKINVKEAKPISSAKCPTWLVGIARKEWNRVAGELDSLGLLSSIDSVALAGYCAAFQRWRIAEDNLREHGMVTVSSKSGFQIQSPYVSIASTALDQVRKFLIEFGMSPSSRSKVVSSPKKDEEEKTFWAQFENDSRSPSRIPKSKTAKVPN